MCLLLIIYRSADALLDKIENSQVFRATLLSSMVLIVYDHGMSN